MRRLLTVAAIVLAFPAQAATFSVDLNAKITNVFGIAFGDFVNEMPFALGDTFRISAEFSETPASTQTTPFLTEYRGALVGLQGSLGDYEFGLSTSDVPINTTQVRGAVYPDLTSDSITGIYSVSGGSIAGWTPNVLNYLVRDESGALLPDDAYGPHLFDPALLSTLQPGPNTEAQLVMHFVPPTGTRGSVRVYADLLVGPITPVPLPASAWLLLAGVALLARRKGLS